MSDPQEKDEGYAIIYLYTKIVEKSVKLAEKINGDCQLSSVITAISVDSEEIREVIPKDIIKQIPAFVVKYGSKITICDELNNENLDNIFNIAKRLCKKFGDGCNTKQNISSDEEEEDEDE